jgi:hypothetical protein
MALSSEPEPPFQPREKIVEKQRYFQSVQRPAYLKGRYDMVTSVPSLSPWPPQECSSL